MNEEEAQRLRAADRFNAFVAVRPDLDAPRAGAISGCTLAVKDNIGVAGLPFTAGHPLYAERIAPADAEAVRRLRRAGARIVGVTQTDAGGFGVTTPAVINPLAPELTAGGSSGGAAVAVAAGLADLGLGTDTGGSVRIPAACCGLFGFKPTWGRVPLIGVWPMAPQFDHVGLIGGELDLLTRAATALLGGEDPQARAIRSVGLDFARLAAAAPDIRAALMAASRLLEQAGIEICAISLPGTSEVVQTHGVLTLAAARAVYAGLGAAEVARLASTAQKSLSMARRLDAAAIEKAAAAAVEITHSVEAIFARVDAVLTPTLSVSPPERNARRVLVAGEEIPVVSALIAETCLANLTGVPALALPFGRPRPVPVSIQFMMERGGDLSLLRLAGALERLIAPVRSD